MDDKKRGGAGRGQGRKPLAKTGELMKARPLRMTDEEWAKCKRLGGAVWVRAKIKAARETQRRAKGRPLADGPA